MGSERAGYCLQIRARPPPPSGPSSNIKVHVQLTCTLNSQSEYKRSGMMGLTREVIVVVYLVANFAGEVPRISALLRFRWGFGGKALKHFLVDRPTAFAFLRLPAHLFLTPRQFLPPARHLHNSTSIENRRTIRWALSSTQNGYEFDSSPLKFNALNMEFISWKTHGINGQKCSPTATNWQTRI